MDFFGSSSSSSLSSKSLPAPVKEQVTQRPECRLSIQSFDRLQFQNGKGTEEKTMNYYLQCPEDRQKRLIHREQSTTENNATNNNNNTQQNNNDNIFRHFIIDGDNGNDNNPLRSWFGSSSSSSSSSSSMMSPFDNTIDSLAESILNDFFGNKNHLGKNNPRLPFPFPRTDEWSIPSNDKGNTVVPQESVVVPRTKNNHDNNVSSPSLTERERGKGVFI